MSQILVMFADLSIEETSSALDKVVVRQNTIVIVGFTFTHSLTLTHSLSLLLSILQRLVTSLYILIQFFCAYVQLGGQTHSFQQEMGGAWGGKEGIGKWMTHTSWLIPLSTLLH